MKMNKKILSGLAIFLMLAGTLFSLAYADIGGTLFWTETGNSSLLSVERGEDAAFFVSLISSEEDFNLWIELLRDGRDGRVVRDLIPPGAEIPGGLDRPYQDTFILDTGGLAGDYTMRVTAVSPEDDYVGYLPLHVETRPTLSIVPDEYAVNEGEILRIMRIVGVDLDGDNLTFVARRVCSTLPYPSNISCAIRNIFIGPRDNNLDASMAFDQERGQFTFTPDFTFVQHPAREREFRMQFRAHDGERFSAWEQVTITVQDINRVPRTTSVPVLDAQERAGYSYRIMATDADEEDTLRFALLESPSNMIITSSGLLRWTPGYDDAGSHDVTVRVADGIDQAVQEFTIIVANTNRAPVLDAVGDQNVLENEPLEFTVTGSDADGEAISFSAEGLPEGAAFDPLTQQFSWIPTIEQRGSHEVTFIVSDGSLTDQETITIAVGTSNQAPVLTLVERQFIAEGELLEFMVSAADPDGDAVAFGFEDVPENASFIDNGDGTATFSWTPDFEQAGEYEIEVSAGDGDLYTIGTVRITVQDTPRPFLTKCSDGQDNDDDGLIDLADPGCTDETDNDEANGVVPPLTQCSDSLDNDGDGLIDLADPGCSSSRDNDETDGVVPPLMQCSDGLDNDGDGLTDLADPGCDDAADNDESDGPAIPPEAEVCGDSLDNDGDGLIDEGCAFPCPDTDGDGLCDDEDEIILGCTDPAAVNYRPQADINDGSCQFAELSDILELHRVQLSSESVLAGETLYFNLQAANEGEIDLEELQFTVIMPDLGVYRTTARFDLDEGEDISRGLAVQIPAEALAGEYLVKITVSNREHRESAYRIVQVH